MGQADKNYRGVNGRFKGSLSIRGRGGETQSGSLWSEASGSAGRGVHLVKEGGRGVLRMEREILLSGGGGNLGSQIDLKKREGKELKRKNFTLNLHLLSLL